MIRFNLSKAINALSKIVRLPGTIVSDTFTRADSTTTLGNAETGQAWSALAGTWGISSNTAYTTTTTAPGSAVVDSGVSNCIIKAKIATQQGGAYVAFRAVNATNFLFFGNNGGTAYKLYKLVANILTEVGSYAQAPQNGDSIKITAIGNTITCYVNDIQLIQATIADLNTATKHGFCSYNATNARWDDFSVEAV